jgi:hypothetical protein
VSRAESHGPFAFGGGELAGDQWVRILYLDESGIGKIEKDPILVVAGVLIHADSQWGPISNRLNKILLDAVPIGQKTPRYLHAKDIFHGSGEFPRGGWPDTVRFGILEELSKLPEEFDVPVVWSSMNRRAYAKEYPTESRAEHLRDAYTVCAIACCMQAEVYMRELPNCAEVSSIVLEQNKELEKRIPEMFAFMRNPSDEDKEKLLPGWNLVMPFQKIIDDPSSQPKSASNILQLADFCAFAIKRRLQNAKGSHKLTAGFVPNLMMFKEGDLQNRTAMWNPRYMPQRYGHKIEFRDGRFMLRGAS